MLNSQVTRFSERFKDYVQHCHMLHAPNTYGILPSNALEMLISLLKFGKNLNAAQMKAKHTYLSSNESDMELLAQKAMLLRINLFNNTKNRKQKPLL